MKTTCSFLHRIPTATTASGRTRGIGQRVLALVNIYSIVCLASLLLAASASPARASDPVGLYAFVDKVVLEPNDTAPERVQIWGGFALAQGGGDQYAPAQRGYMYFKLKPDKETVCRNEWADLKSVAGSGRIVAFGMRYASNGTVRKSGDKAENPDAYPVGFGLQKISIKDYKPINELKALMSAQPTEKKSP